MWSHSEHHHDAADDRREKRVCSAGQGLKSEDSMLHYSCDMCKRPIAAGTDLRHVVKIEVFPAVEDQSCGCPGGTSSDHDSDNLDEMQELLERLDESELADLEDDTRSLRFDLCDDCRQRFVKNPLGAKGGKQLDFSNN
jgi:hypothetical protein